MGKWLIFSRIDLLITLAHPSIVWVHVQHAIIIAWNDLESVSLSSSARTVDDMVATQSIASGRATIRCISVITITRSCLSTIRNNTHEYSARWTTGTINADIINVTLGISLWLTWSELSFKLHCHRVIKMARDKLLTVSTCISFR